MSALRCRLKLRENELTVGGHVVEQTHVANARRLTQLTRGTQQLYETTMGTKRKGPLRT